MELNDYQKQAMTTCMDSCDNFSYMMLNLVAELGEFSGKVAKAIRKEKAMIENNQLLTERGTQSMSDDEIADLKDEAGDILWQLSGLCNTMGWTLEEIGLRNLLKLSDRKNRGVIDGNGDRR